MEHSKWGDMGRVTRGLSAHVGPHQVLPSMRWEAIGDRSRGTEGISFGVCVKNGLEEARVEAGRPVRKLWLSSRREGLWPQGAQVEMGRSAQVLDIF